MRTQDEIVARIRLGSEHLFNFSYEVLVTYLDFDHAKEFLKPEITREKWEHGRSATEADALEEMRSYAEFAWGKARDHRGISANRSVQKLEAWTWLLGRDEVLGQSEAAAYSQYGCPKLAIICRAFGFPIPDDEGLQRMIRGEPCRPDCDMGCGR